MSEQNGSAQDQTASVPPVATGPNVAELQARVAELERAKEGLIRETQQERAKRHELEARLNPPPAPPAVNGDVDEEVRKIVEPSVRTIIAPMQAELQEYKRKEALSYLASKTGKTVEQVEADKELQARIMAVGQKYGVSGDLMTATRRAYELVELEAERESLKTKEAERARAATIATQAPLSGGSAPAPVSSRVYSADMFNKLSSAEYASLAQKGGFKKTPEGFVYTPR